MSDTLRISPVNCVREVELPRALNRLNVTIVLEGKSKNESRLFSQFNKPVHNVAVMEK